MAIRIREVNGRTVALCAVESDPTSADIYLDDTAHYALAAKFAHDWRSLPGGARLPEYPEEWAAMATQKVRDAEEELKKWAAEHAALGPEK